MTRTTLKMAYSYLQTCRFCRDQDSAGTDSNTPSPKIIRKKSLTLIR